MSSDDDPRESRRQIEDFLGEPTREVDDWRWLWETNQPFPIASRPGLLGRAVGVAKRLLRPFVRLGGSDLWERQRVFNLIVLERVYRWDNLKLEARTDTLEHKTAHLEAFLEEGLEELMRYNDALYSRVDQKLDRYRREAAELVALLHAAAQAPTPSAPAARAIDLGEVLGDRDYQELERRFRGSESEIRERVSAHLDDLRGRERVLDLGCGRGEALAVMQEAGIGCRGVDASLEMVRICRERGLEAEQGDLMACLEAAAEGSFDGVVSFHVIEHLPVATVVRLTRLAWRALAPGGVLLLETPNPRSLAVAASLFWRDPTHLRPIHPDVLRWALEMAGFDQVEIRDLHPFPAEERLPEMDLTGLGGEALEQARRINELRDRLDETIWGWRDYAAVAVKAPAA